MWLVDKHEGPIYPSDSDLISSEKKRALINSRGLDRASSDDDDRITKLFLAEAHRREKWIICDCQQTDNQYPVLSIREYRNRKTGERTYTVANMTLRQGAHKSSCPLKCIRNLDFDSKDTNILKKKPNRKDGRRFPKEQALSLYGNKNIALTEKTEAEARTSNSSSGYRRLSIVINFLYTILEENQLNLFPHPNTSAGANNKGQLPILWTALKKEMIAPGVHFDKHLICSLRKDILKDGKRYLAGIKHWSQGYNPYSIVIAIIDSYDKERKTFTKNNIGTYAYHGKAFNSAGGYFSKNKGPFLALITLAPIQNRNNEILFDNIYLIPVLAPSVLVPVDSDIERRVAKKLHVGNTIIFQQPQSDRYLILRALSLILYFNIRITVLSLKLKVSTMKSIISESLLFVRLWKNILRPFLKLIYQ